MKTVDFRIDVSGATGLAEGAELAMSLHLPDEIPVGGLLELLVCVHGGGYHRGYWHPTFIGHAGYSFAEHLTANGRAVLAVDLLGMGESTQPDPETKLSRAKVAAANHHATRQVAQGLTDGRWAQAGRVTVTGVGHSIGGMMVITQQAAHKSFDRLAVLGWANEPMLLGDTDPVALAATIQPGYLMTPRALMRTLFYIPDVPLALIEADEAIASPTPACLGRDALLPGIVHEAAASIACPVFVMHGSTDTSSNPYGEPQYFKNSTDVTLMLLHDTAHCHNFETHRHELWNRLDRWITSLPVS
jgi:pimeloyl-ACP methyl ester carboxylesterase